MAENKENPSFMDKFKSPLSTLWDNHRTFLIIFGILILIFKFREVIIDLLVSSARKTVNEAREKDSTLKAEQTQANDQADQLRKEAEALSENKPKVDEDWYKK